MSQSNYYGDNTQWGNYQYINFEEAIIDYMGSRGPDDYDFDTPRHLAIAAGRRVIKEFYFDLMQEVKAIEMTLGPSLQLVLPHDYVDLVRISRRDQYGNLFPLIENRALNVSRNYLQDHSYDLLFDHQGTILEASKKKDSDYVKQVGSAKNYTLCYPSSYTPNFNSNLSKVYEFGSYLLDKDSGVIRFSSQAEFKDIVLEYISDGLYLNDGKSETETKIKIHKFAEEAFNNGLYYFLIRKRRNVPANEKARARKEYFNSRRIAKRRINQSDRNELIQAMKGVNVWNKNM